jgi:hypothetical protein
MGVLCTGLFTGEPCQRLQKIIVTHDVIHDPLPVEEFAGRFGSLT